MKILLVGGGTLGSVSPLIAVGQDLLEQPAGHEIRFWGTSHGPEKKVIESLGIVFLPLAGGKLRRYWSWWNLLAPFQTLCGFWQAVVRLGQWRPDLILTAGSFIAVPVVWAAWWRRLPVVAHQQDVKVGLANKLIFPLAKVVTKVFNDYQGYVPRRAVLTGNAVRPEFLADWSGQVLTTIKQRLNLNDDLPIVLCLGGSSGASGLNKLIIQALPQLQEFCQIVHVTGAGKDTLVGQHQHYLSLPFITEAKTMAELLAIASVVISRSGMGTLSELSALNKPSILAPLPDTHQELNARVIVKQGGALMIDQKAVRPEEFVSLLRGLLADQTKLQVLQESIGQILPTISGGEYFDKVREALHR